MLLVVLAAVFVAARPLSDPDVWWHLRTGELILERGLVSADPWSYMSEKPWQLHEWLSEVLMYLAFSVAGYSGVVAFVSLLVAAFATVLVISCRRVSGPLIASTTALLACIATVPGMAARPQLVSWLLLAAAAPYMRAQVRDRRLPWWLLPMTWAWANLHGLWLMAVALFAALVFGLALEQGLRGWRITARFSGFTALLTCVPATTPLGPDLLLAPFHVREYAPFVSEWDPPSVASIPTACALSLLLIVVLGWARSATPVPSTTIAFVVAAAGMGMLYSRTVPVLAIALAPLAAATLQDFSGPMASELGSGTRAKIASASVVMLAIATVSFAVKDAAIPQPGAPFQGATTQGVLAATDAVERLPGRVRLLNQYELGGWLLWAARDTSPVIDGRADIYTVQHFRAYVKAVNMQPGWRNFVTDMDADAALLFRQAPLADGLQLSGWTVEHEGGGLVVLVPPHPAQVRR